jgi:hypothetical protein
LLEDDDPGCNDGTNFLAGQVRVASVILELNNLDMMIETRVKNEISGLVPPTAWSSIAQITTFTRQI